MLGMKEYFYGDFEIGKKILTRTRYITNTDIDLFVALSGAYNPLFLSNEIAKSKGFKGKICPGVAISALSFGLEYQTGVYDNIIGLLEVDEMKYKAPLMVDDPLRVELEVIEKRETSKRDRGIVIFKRRCYVRKKEIVEAKLIFMYLNRDSQINHNS